MPVTAKLSKKFYETFGDDIANELVEWFNLVDATYRADLRTLNETNFQRFDAKVEQRFAEFEARWERRFVELDAKWEKRFAELDAKWESRFTALDAKWERRFAELRSHVAAQKADLIKWMFTFWAGNVLTTAALILALVSLLR